MIRKDLNSPSMYETGIAMSDLSCFINSDLVRDLANAVMTLVTSTKPYILLVPISSDLPNNNASIQLCVQKLRILIEDSDQNLKYIGSLAMSTILHTHPKSIQSHSDLIMRCLDLLSRMVTRKALIDIVHKLMIHMDKSEGSLYRDELVSKIIEICSQNDYQHITNFEWFTFIFAILLENAYVFIHDSNSTPVVEVLYAAAWICSEFCSKVNNVKQN
ncbi:unnamed protein product [Rotaria sordida]|uniref:Clathrin/coatomer adaptor adaptin-like N-terminal domain-containing protein n=1 Tax=Rotaria sordida TaxID=392033 RepID=A0A815HMD3_9BILA|nr:unnamed protein product [Rotaria sordida]CAF1603647.1 unnamed protein product [Rotaria sordida]